MTCDREQHSSHHPYVTHFRGGGSLIVAILKLFGFFCAQERVWGSFPPYWERLSLPRSHKTSAQTPQKQRGVFPFCFAHSKPWQRRFCASLPADKCITSELLKDIPLTGVLGGSLSAEAELLKGGKSCLKSPGGGSSPPLNPPRASQSLLPTPQARCPPRRSSSMATSRPSQSTARRRMGGR